MLNRELVATVHFKIADQHSQYESYARNLLHESMRKNLAHLFERGYITAPEVIVSFNDIEEEESLEAEELYA